MDLHPPMRHFIQGLVVIGLLIFAKTVGVEETRFGQQVEQMTINLLQLHLADRALGRKERIAVVDITSLQQVNNQLAQEENKLITPREQLAHVIDSVAAAKPEAIGIDIYFELNAQGQLSDKDTWFLDHCLEVQSRKNIPIYVGIYRSIVRGRQYWLDYPRFASLGAAIVIPRSDRSTAPVSQLFTVIGVPVGGGIVSANSLSFALYGVARKDWEQKRWLGSALHNAFPSLIEREFMEEHEDRNISSRGFSIDFGSMEGIIKAKIPAEEVGKDTSLLQGKIVLIGRGTDGETSDTFNIPGRGSPVPGVYIHAVAVDTLLESPLFTLSKSGHIFADILVSLVPLAFIFFLERSLRYPKSPAFSDSAVGLKRILRKLWQAVATIVKIFSRPSMMAMVVIVIGWSVNLTGIYWTDFLLVAVALLLHNKTEQFFQYVLSNRQLAHQP